MHLTQVSTLKIVLCLPLSSLPEKSFSLRTQSEPFWRSNGELVGQIALSFWALKPPHLSRYIITYSKIAQTQLLSICFHTSFAKCWKTYLSWIYRTLVCRIIRDHSIQILYIIYKENGSSMVKGDLPRVTSQQGSDRERTWNSQELNNLKGFPSKDWFWLMGGLAENKRAWEIWKYELRLCFSKASLPLPS